MSIGDTGPDVPNEVSHTIDIREKDETKN